MNRSASMGVVVDDCKASPGCRGRWLGSTRGVSGLETKAREHFGAAKKAASGIPWLVELSRYQLSVEDAVEERSVLFGQLERVEAILERLGKLHDRQFDKREKEILEGLDSTMKGPFESAHCLLGEMLGFVAGKKEVDASPDPAWLAKAFSPCLTRFRS